MKNCENSSEIAVPESENERVLHWPKPQEKCRWAVNKTLTLLLKLLCLIFQQMSLHHRWQIFLHYYYK